MWRVTIQWRPTHKILASARLKTAAILRGAPESHELARGSDVVPEVRAGHEAGTVLDLRDHGFRVGVAGEDRVLRVVHLHVGRHCGEGVVCVVFRKRKGGSCAGSNYTVVTGCWRVSIVG